MDKIKPLFTATATATGGRNGHTQSSDGSVAAELSVPKEMGGPGKPGTTTPEHLFAAGYAACFGGALDLVAKQHKEDASNAKVTCAVSLARARAAALGSPSRCASRTRAFRKESWRSSLRRRTRRSVPIRTQRAGTWTSRLTSLAPERPILAVAVQPTTSMTPIMPLSS